LKTQVLAIQNAKKQGVEYFQFPGDPQNVLLKPVCGFFITMNPGTHLCLDDWV
jgi:dynein heavy chain